MGVGQIQYTHTWKLEKADGIQVNQEEVTTLGQGQGKSSLQKLEIKEGNGLDFQWEGVQLNQRASAMDTPPRRSIHSVTDAIN